MVTRTPVVRDNTSIVALIDRGPLHEAAVIKIMVALLILAGVIAAGYLAAHGIEHPTSTVPGLTSDHPVRWPY